MHLTHEDRGSAVLMTVTTRRLDTLTAVDVREAASDAIRPGRDLYLLNLEHVSYIDSSGIGALVGLMKRLGRGRRLELCALAPAVRKVFRLTHLDAVFTLHPSADAALASHRQAGTALGG